jgi:site-specific recombinase XerD
MIITLILNLLTDTGKLCPSKVTRLIKGQHMEDNALIPTPLELLSAPESLSGASGTNRAPTFITQQIAATNDLQAVQCWLAEFDQSPQTQRSYRKEAERLLLWSLIEKQKPLSSLTRDDFRDYQKFLSDPQPEARWCGQRKPRHNLNWRPFQGPLSGGSVAQAITIINALLSYLVEAGYLSGNPLGLMRRKTKQHSLNKANVTERFLEQALWQLVVDYIEGLPKTTSRKQKEYERIRFLFHLLYLQGPRVSEVANSQMQSVKQIRGKWWWQVIGKGQKTQAIPINESMLNALIRYRQFYGLSQLPQPDDQMPLFMNLNGTQGVSNNMIYRLVKKTFLDCAETFKKSRPDFYTKLKQASTHWMRHTSITHQADAGIELRYIKRHARHESVETTMLYQHAEEDQWHDAMSHHRMPEK